MVLQITLVSAVVYFIVKELGAGCQKLQSLHHIHECFNHSHANQITNNNQKTSSEKPYVPIFGSNIKGHEEKVYLIYCTQLKLCCRLPYLECSCSDAYSQTSGQFVGAGPCDCT